MSTEENRAAVHRILDEAYDKGNLSTGDELVAPNALLPTPAGDMQGIDGWKQYANLFLTGFRGISVAPHHTVAEGDKVVVHWTAQATHEGDFRGIAPTGKQVTMSGFAMYRFAGGKIEEMWGWQDTMGLMQQLGVIPSSG